MYFRGNGSSVFNIPNLPFRLGCRGKLQITFYDLECFQIRRSLSVVTKFFCWMTKNRWSEKVLTNYVPEPNFMQSRSANQKRSKCSVRSEWASLFCTDLLCHQHLNPHELRKKVFHSVLGGMAMQTLWKRVIRLLYLTSSQEPSEWREAGAYLFFNRAFFFEPVTQHFIFKGSRVAHCALLNFGDRCGIFYNLNHSCGKMHRSDVNWSQALDPEEERLCLCSEAGRELS